MPRSSCPPLTRPFLSPEAGPAQPVGRRSPGHPRRTGIRLHTQDLPSPLAPPASLCSPERAVPQPRAGARPERRRENAPLSPLWWWKRPRRKETGSPHRAAGCERHTYRDQLLLQRVTDVQHGGRRGGRTRRGAGVWLDEAWVWAAGGPGAEWQPPGWLGLAQRLRG